MRNLKKVLSLALALVMLLGMMVVGAGAATNFKDDDKIDNQVAVAVSNKIGVLVGDENGNFNPDGTLTRAEAAVAIARLDLGTSAANALAATNAATFKDVPGTHWGKPYIDYCAGNGYIVGDENGNFLPNKTVSSVEFATMVARMLGYNTKNEGIEGNADWAVKAAALARKAGLSTDVLLTTTTAMTRDEMAQMVFNSLTAPMVEYDGLNVSVNGVAITSNVKVRTHTGSSSLGVSNTTYDYEPIKANITPIRLCEEKFPDLKLRTQSYDSFGRDYSVWTWKNVEITGSSTQVTPDASFHAWTDVPDVKSATNSASGTAAEVYINGRRSVESVDATYINGLTGSGRLVQVYLNDSNKKLVDKVVVIDTYVAHVNSISKNGTDDRYITLNVYDKNVLKPLDKTFETADFAVGDLVTYKAAYSTSDSKYHIQEVAPLEVSATATLEKWVGSNLTNEKDKGTSNANFTADGQKYSYSRNSVIVDENGDGIEISNFTAGKSEINIYLDEFEYAIYVSGVEAAKNYAAVIGVGKSNQYGSETRGATLLLPDGTTKEVTAKMKDWSVLRGIKTDDKTIASIEADKAQNLVTDGVADIVTYSVGDDDVYTLNLVKTNTTSTGSYVKNPAKTEFTNGRSQMTIDGNADLYTTSKTIFMIGVPDGNTYSYSAFTGYASAPGVKESAVKGVSYGLNSKYTKQIDVVYIDASEVVGIVTAKTYFVFNRDEFKITTNGTNKFYTLPAVVDGEVTEITIDAALQKQWGADVDYLENAPAGLYVIKNVKKDKNDVIVDCVIVPNSTEFGAANNKQGTIRANGEVLGFGKPNNGDNYMAYGDSTKVYYVDDEFTTITASNVSAVPTDSNDRAYAAHDNGSPEKKLTNVFIVEIADGTTGDNTANTPQDSTIKIDADTLTVDIVCIDNDSKIASTLGAKLRNMGYKPIGAVSAADGATIQTQDVDGDFVTFTVARTDKYTIKVDDSVKDTVVSGTNITASKVTSITNTGKGGTGYTISHNGATATYAAYGAPASLSITGPVVIKTGYVKVATAAAATITKTADSGLTVTETTKATGKNDWKDKTYAAVGDELELMLTVTADPTRYQSSKAVVTGALTGEKTITAATIKKGGEVTIKVSVNGTADVDSSGDYTVTFTKGNEALTGVTPSTIGDSGATKPGDGATDGEKQQYINEVKTNAKKNLGVFGMSKELADALDMNGEYNRGTDCLFFVFDAPTTATHYALVVEDAEGNVVLVFTDSITGGKRYFSYFGQSDFESNNNGINDVNKANSLENGKIYKYTIYTHNSALTVGPAASLATNLTGWDVNQSDTFRATAGT